MKIIFLLTFFYLILVSISDYKKVDASSSQQSKTKQEIDKKSPPLKQKDFIEKEAGDLSEIISFEDLKKVRKLTKVEEACMMNDFDKLQELVKKGESLNSPDNKIGSPLLYAVFHDNLEMMLFLIEKGANINFKMENGLTALGLAVSRNQVTLASVLIKKGADVHSKIQGTSLIEIAEKMQHFQIVDMLKDKGISSRMEFSKN